MAKIIISSLPEETRMGIIENGRLAEYTVERNTEAHLVGSIFFGRVNNVVRGIQAAFIDIGLDQNAFLYIGDDTKVTEGKKMLVQIAKDARGTKGPTATRELSLPGRYAVLLPDGDYIGISRKITDSDERARLREIASTVKKEGFAIVIRTAAQGVDSETLLQDLRRLSINWQIIKSRAQIAKSPQMLYRELDISVRIVRDYLNSNVDEIVVDDTRVYNHVCELLKQMPQTEQYKIVLHKDSTDVFSEYGLAEEIASISDRRVDLDCGGYLIIDHTEAMTVIDVNSGHYTGKETLEETIMQTNREAAKEIARQLRLRDIGGIIIVDFIDMQEESHKAEIMKILKTSLAGDKMRPCVQDMTVLNLVEITRKKARQNLSAVLYTTCPICQGSGRVQSQETVCLEIKRRLRSVLQKKNASRNILIMVHPWLAEWMRIKGIKQWEKELNCTLQIEADTRQHLETFSLLDNTGVDKHQRL